jgi:prepilin-type N-terminal cleavage/methylation domain-containing protein
MVADHKLFVAVRRSLRWRRRSSGFTLIELLITLVVFLVISGATFELVSRHMPLFARQQSQSALNFSLRNAAAQIQIDVVNAGNGFYPSADVSAWPIGIQIKNNDAGSGCYDSVAKTYGPKCFDALTILATDRGVSPGLVVKDTSGAPCVSGDVLSCNSTLSALYVTPSDTTVSLATYALSFKKGDKILFVRTMNGQSLMTTAVLSDNGSVSNQAVYLPHYVTDGGGKNSLGSANDPLGLTAFGQTYDWSKPLGDVANDGATLTSQFDDSKNSWILKLAPITYRVDASDSTNPKLMRQDSKDCPPDPSDSTKGGCIIAEQTIGFKVGASAWNGNSDSSYSYSYDPTNPTAPSYRLGDIRAVRITIIGRTDPNAGTANFYNTFDQGPYRIEAVSVVVNPRNLSMNDGQ